VNARLFEELRPVGFAVAYRMVGSVSEAEDIVQEALLRLHHTLQDGERIESPRAYLSTVVTRLCINHLRSARARRETYVEALPEPLVGEPGAAVPLVPASGPAGVADTGDPASHEGQQARQREHDPQRVGTAPVNRRSTRCWPAGKSSSTKPSPDRRTGTGASSTVAGQPGS
jgi:RNA polymerase sigma factor (sigma-70 family)